MLNKRHLQRSIKSLSFFFCLLLLLLSNILIAAPQQSLPAKTEYSSLQHLTNDAADALKQNIGIKTIVLDKSFIKDSTTGETANLSGYIKNELEASFSQAGLTLIDDMQEADYFITISYQKDRDNLSMFIKYRKSKGDMA